MLRNTIIAIYILLYIKKSVTIGSLNKYGKAANIANIPYQASLLHKEVHFCGACIIKPTFLISAAHCFFSPTKNLNDLTVRTGSNFTNTGGILSNVSHYYISPRYNPETSRCDIAIIQLKNALTYTTTIQPIGMAKKKALPSNRMAIVSGWGERINDRDMKRTKRLQWALVRVYPRVLCKYVYSWHYINSMFCAGNFEGTDGSCTGDSGGPLVVNGKLLGIVSMARTGCTTRLHPALYTNAVACRDWVEQII